MLIDDGALSSGGGDGSSATELTALAVPPTIQALIAARLDRLGPDERAVLEAASIEGKQFARERLEALVSDSESARVDVHLRALTRKDLIRSVGAERGRLPLPPPADPRRRLRGHAQGAARRSPRALRAPARRRVE